MSQQKMAVYKTQPTVWVIGIIEAFQLMVEKRKHATKVMNISVANVYLPSTVFNGMYMSKTNAMYTNQTGCHSS